MSAMTRVSSQPSGTPANIAGPLRAELRRRDLTDNPVRYNEGTIIAIGAALDMSGYVLVRGHAGRLELDEDALKTVEAHLETVGARRTFGPVIYRSGSTVPRILESLKRLGWGLAGKG